MKVVSNDPYDFKHLLRESKIILSYIQLRTTNLYIVIIWDQTHQKNDIQDDDNNM